jgi:hypothetical protein
VDAFVNDTTIQVWHQNYLIKTVARVRKGLCARSVPMGYASTTGGAKQSTISRSLTGAQPSPLGLAETALR